MARKAKGLSQEALALEANIAPSYIGGVERGQRNPSFKKLCAIAKIVTVQVLWAAVVGRRDERLADHGHLDSIPEVAALFAAGAQVTANAAKHLRTLECAKAP